MRELNKFEIAVIAGFAEKLEPARKDRLLADLSIASVESETDNGTVVKFLLEGYQRPAYRGQHLFPVEGRVLDLNGSAVAVLLFADENDRLLELDLLSPFESRTLSPQISTLEIY